MFYRRNVAGRDGQGCRPDWQGEQPGTQNSERGLPGLDNGRPRYQLATQPIALEFAQVSQHFLFPRPGLGKARLRACALAGRATGPWSSSTASVHTLASITIVQSSILYR